MTYEEKKKVVEAANLVKENCDKCYRYQTDCENCVFDVNGCLLNLHGIPRYWNIPKLSRWTPEDVALAKALKGFGVEFVIREDDINVVSYNEDGKVIGRFVNRNIFRNANPMDTISIDTIIKEAEES